MPGLPARRPSRSEDRRAPRRRAYILLTDAALRWVGVSPGRAGLSAHSERYEHFGDVQYFVMDRAAGMAIARADVPPEHALAP